MSEEGYSTPDPGQPLQEFYNGTRLLNSSIVLMVLVTCLVGLGLCSDKLDRKDRRWFLDDIILLVSYICFMTLCAVMIGALLPSSISNLTMPSLTDL